MKHKVRTPWAPATKIAHWIRGNFCSRSRTPSNSDCGDIPVMGNIKRKASRKTERKKVQTGAKEDKLWRPTENEVKSQTSRQPTSVTQNNTWSPPRIRSGKLYFQSLSWNLWNIAWRLVKPGAFVTGGEFLLPSFIEMFAFLLFLRPGFLTSFCPRRRLSFRWIHSVSFHGLYIKKIHRCQRPKRRETAQLSM